MSKVLKIVVGLSLAGVASLLYATAFAYSNPVLVYAALGASFILLTLPVWLAFLGKPVRRLWLYYLIVVVLLVSGVMGRFVIEALQLSRQADQ